MQPPPQEHIKQKQATNLKKAFSEDVMFATFKFIYCSNVTQCKWWCNFSVSLSSNWTLLTSKKITFYWKHLVLAYLRTNLLTYLFTPFSRVLLEKLTNSQLVKKFPTYCGTRSFITTFTSACHMSLSFSDGSYIKSYLPNQPITTNRFLPEKLIVSEPPIFYGMWWFNMTNTTSHHFYLS